MSLCQNIIEDSRAKKAVDTVTQKLFRLSLEEAHFSIFYAANLSENFTNYSQKVTLYIL